MAAKALDANFLDDVVEETELVPVEGATAVGDEMLDALAAWAML